MIHLLKSTLLTPDQAAGCWAALIVFIACILFCLNANPEVGYMDDKKSFIKESHPSIPKEMRMILLNRRLKNDLQL